MDQPSYSDTIMHVDALHYADYDDRHLYDLMDIGIINH